MNLGTTAATGMLMYAGYVSGAAMLPVSIGGKGFKDKRSKYYHHLLSLFLLPYFYYC